MKKIKLNSFICLALLGLSGQNAAEAAAIANEGDILTRVRMINVIPNERSSITPIGGKVRVNNNLVPEIDFTYFINENFAAELILATSRHKMQARGTTLGNVNVGSVWLLPPTLTLQYHYNCLELLKPYVGAGLNYTFFYGAKPGNLANVKYDNRGGYLFQAGLDMPFMGESTYLNLDVKKLYLKARARFNNNTIRADVNLDPWILGVGIGYKF